MIAPQPDWKALVNRGVQDFSWDTEYNYETVTVTTVANTAEYLLSAVGTPMFKFLTECLRDSTQVLYSSDETVERGRNPLWLAAESSPPTRYWMSNANTLRLFPTPDAVYTITVRGCREAAALSAATDTPVVPGTFHEAICLRAAALHVEPFMSDEAATKKLDLYRSQYGGLVKACRKALRTENVQKQRYVVPRAPELVWAVGGWRGWNGR